MTFDYIAKNLPEQRKLDPVTDGRRPIDKVTSVLQASFDLILKLLTENAVHCDRTYLSKSNAV